MKQNNARQLRGRRWLVRTHRGWLALLCALVLSACGSAPSNGAATTATETVATVAPTKEATTTTEEGLPTEDPNAAPVTAAMEELELKGEHYAAIGDPNAPITVIEFSDYGCPFCRRYSGSTYPAIKEEFIDTGKVYYVFKDYPIAQLHPQTEIAAQAAECAGAQGKYWELHAVLFDRASAWDTTEDEARAAMDSYAAELSLDAAAFTSCMEPDSPARVDVEANMAEGRRLNITGTPSFVINGKLLAGAQPLNVFQRVFTRELQNAGQ